MNIIKKNFYIKDCSHEYLMSKGFRFRRGTIADEPDIYMYRFAIYKYKNKMNTLDCKITINAETGKVFLMVTQQDGSIYSPFYDEDHYGNFSEMLTVVNSNILKKFGELGIEERY